MPFLPFSLYGRLPVEQDTSVLSARLVACKVVGCRKGPSLDVKSYYRETGNGFMRNDGTHHQASARA